MWSFPLLFFAFQFILRLWPGLMMQEFMQQYAIDAAGFGLIAAFYYYGYAGMQVPTAILLDKFGAKKVIFVFALFCGAGAYLFTISSNFYIALLSRFMIGAGSAVGILGVSKVVSDWFDKGQYAKMIGFSFSLGLIGAVYGGKPLSKWLAVYGGYRVGITLAIVISVLGFLCFITLRQPKNNNDSFEKLRFSNFISLLSSPIIWAVAMANLLMVGALEGFADVWGVPYLMTAYSFGKTDAAFLASLIFVGMIAGGPLMAWFGKKFGNYLSICLCGVGLAVIFLFLLAQTFSSSLALSILLFSVGVLCSYQVLIFAVGSSMVSSSYAGVTVAFLNCINMLGGSLFHTVIGKIMSYYGNEASGFSTTAFQHALSIIPICALLGTGCIYIVKLRVTHTKKSSQFLLTQ